MVDSSSYLKDPLLLIENSSPFSSGSGFPISLSEWSFTTCPTLYNRKENVLSASLNITFPSFLPFRYLSGPLLTVNIVLKHFFPSYNTVNRSPHRRGINVSK